MKKETRSWQNSNLQSPARRAETAGNWRVNHYATGPSDRTFRLGCNMFCGKISHSTASWQETGDNVINSTDYTTSISSERARDNTVHQEWRMIDLILVTIRMIRGEGGVEAIYSSGYREWKRR